MTAPRYLHFQLTERCNLACPGCYLDQRTGPGASAEDIEATVFSPLAASGARFATLTGGEPLLHPRWPEICAAAARHFDNVQLVCNGTLLTVDAYAALAQAGVAAVKVSLDGPEAAIHDALRGVPGCFDRVMANLRAIAALPAEARGGIDLGCICTVYPQNVGRLRETAALVEELGLNSLLFQPFHPHGLLYPPPAEPGKPVRTDPDFLAALAGELDRLRELRRTKPGFLDNSLAMLDRFEEFFTDPDGPAQVCGADRFVFVNSRFEVRGCLFCRPLGSLRDASPAAFRQGQAWRGFDAFRRGCRRCLMGCQFVDKAQDLAEEGFVRLTAEDYAGAKAAFDASLALEYSVPAGHGAGAARLQLRELEPSRRFLEAALAHRPKDRLILADLGWNRLLSDDLEGARAAFDASLALGYSLPAGHGAGLVRFRQGELGEARRLLEQARALKPDQFFVLHDLGWVLVHQGAWEELGDVGERLLALDPDNGTSHRFRGLAARQRRDYALALPALRLGLDKGEPDDPWPAFEYGLACLEAQQPHEAARGIALAVERDPNFPWFRYRLAQARLALGQTAEARAACLEAIRLDPGPEAFHRLLAELDKTGKPADAPPA
jgi:MoaA/NifB/PqqE/SkfB family radical SAM enzyme/Tfp pilus assembly protein PilF